MSCAPKSKRNLTMLQNDDIIKYSLVDSGELESDHWAIRIDEGPFKDVIFKYMSIEFRGEDENGFGLVNYNYEIIEDTASLVESKQESFEEYAGKILNAILEESTKGQDGTNRIDDTEEPDSQ